MMNRLLFQTLQTFTAAAAATESYETGIMRSGAEGASHAVFAPLHYEPNYAYPLIVWLHGGGDTEQQLRRVMPFISLRNYVAVAHAGHESCRAATERAKASTGCKRPSTSTMHTIGFALPSTNENSDLTFRADRIFFVGHECSSTIHASECSNRWRLPASCRSVGLFRAWAPLAELNVVPTIPLFVASPAGPVFSDR